MKETKVETTPAGVKREAGDTHKDDAQEIKEFLESQGKDIKKERGGYSTPWQCGGCIFHKYKPSNHEYFPTEFFCVNKKGCVNFKGYEKEKEEETPEDLKKADVETLILRSITE